MTQVKNRNQAIIEEFRENKGKVGGHFQNYTLLLLHTIGAKSGNKRINPMMTRIDGDRFFVVASKGGAHTNPAWYHNAVANPDVTVEFGDEVFEALASVAEEPERGQLYAKMVELSSAFSEYERGTDRVIPVIILTRK